MFHLKQSFKLEYITMQQLHERTCRVTNFKIKLPIATVLYSSTVKWPSKGSVDHYQIGGTYKDSY